MGGIMGAALASCPLFLWLTPEECFLAQGDAPAVPAPGESESTCTTWRAPSVHPFAAYLVPMHWTLQEAGRWGL